MGVVCQDEQPTSMSILHIRMMHPLTHELLLKACMMNYPQIWIKACSSFLFVTIASLSVVRPNSMLIALPCIHVAYIEYTRYHNPLLRPCYVNLTPWYMPWAMIYTVTLVVWHAHSYLCIYYCRFVVFLFTPCSNIMITLYPFKYFYVSVTIEIRMLYVMMDVVMIWYYDYNHWWSPKSASIEFQRRVISWVSS